jgi:hypothetical protein
MRRLVCTRRHVPLDMVDDYLLAWLALRNAVESAGARAWVFRGSTHEDQFLEFIEWSDERPSPLDDADIGTGITQLTAFGAASGGVDEWEEIA